MDGCDSARIGDRLLSSLCAKGRVSAEQPGTEHRKSRHVARIFLNRKGRDDDEPARSLSGCAGACSAAREPC